MKTDNTPQKDFENFLESFIQTVHSKTCDLNNAAWQLETTGEPQAAQKLSKAQQELKMLFCNSESYQTLLNWKKDLALTNPEQKRILDILLFEFKAHQIPKELIEELAELECSLSQTYINFRVPFENKSMTENDLIEMLKTEKNIERRKAIWETTKKIGSILAPQIIAIVKKRNEIAHRLGYNDFYQMQLSLQELDQEWLLSFLKKFEEDSRELYSKLIKEIHIELAKEYQTTPTSIGPWAWRDPFCQEDPLATAKLDSLMDQVDIIKVSEEFFSSLGFNISGILQQSDLFERDGKNQHAFCMNMNREDDIRILTNVRPNIRWLETTLHELGHAAYEQGYDKKMHIYLKTPPHMITTEAIALITGRQAYDHTFLKAICKADDLDEQLKQATLSQKRRQLIFSRWVLVMMHFEAALYADPEQELNNLWWSIVQKYQQISPLTQRRDQYDWACKYHIGLAPVYYHSYLLGEFFGSMLKDHFVKLNGTPSMYQHPNIGEFLKSELFFYGNRMRWDKLIEQMMKEPLQYKSWIEEFS